ncbi:MAG: hypothetical protein HZB91_11580 [Elusimicrobia bacterium]|nr:hypothetical protein [Elusimicrobiota bacterium]
MPLVERVDLEGVEEGLGALGAQALDLEDGQESWRELTPHLRKLLEGPGDFHLNDVSRDALADAGNLHELLSRDPCQGRGMAGHGLGRALICPHPERVGSVELEEDRHLAEQSAESAVRHQACPTS